MEQRYHQDPAKNERRGGDLLSAALAGVASASRRLGDEDVLNDLLATNDVMSTMSKGKEGRKHTPAWLLDKLCCWFAVVVGVCGRNADDSKPQNPAFISRRAVDAYLPGAPASGTIESDEAFVRHQLGSQVDPRTF
jgi:hypothetical protein